MSPFSRRRSGVFGASQQAFDPLPLSRGRIAREALATALGIIAISALGLVVTERVAHHSLQQQIRQQLRDITTVAAGEIDEGARNALIDPGPLRSARYSQAAEPLLRLRRAVPELFYAYSLVPSPEGFRFGVDSSAYIRNPGDDTPVAAPGELYGEAPPGVEAAYRSGEVAVSAKPYTDRWGTFLSAFAPLRDRSGRVVALVGVDLSMARLNALLQPLRLTLALSLLGTTVLAMVVGLGRWRSLQGRARAVRAMAEAEGRAQQAAHSADQANRAKSRFLASMTHELRTPLNGVLGLTELLLGTPLTATQRDCLATVKQSSEGLLHLLDDLIDVAHLEARVLKLEPAVWDLSELLRGVTDAQRPLAAAKALELHLQLAGPDPWPALVDGGRLRQVLGHLIRCGIRSTAEGAVLVSLQPVPRQEEGAWGEFRIRSEAAPLSLEQREQLFEPFGQAPPSETGSNGGNGVELALCQRLATAMGGSLMLEPDPGGGSVLLLTLPLPPAGHAAAPAERAPEPPPEIPRAAAGRDSGPGAAPLRILLAEDNSVNARVCRLMLERLGYGSSLARDGEEAVEAQRELDPDLILMDVRMPRLDGLEATRRIRAAAGEPGRQRPWIIALTANALPSDRAAALASGMDDFLAKPLQLEDLARALQRAEESLAQQGLRH